MKFSAHLKLDNFKYFIDCLSCLNKLTREISKNSNNLVRITKEKTNIITRTNGILDSYFEIFNNELFIEPITLDQESLTLEVNINTFFDSLNSSLKSEYILLHINDKEEDYLYIKYLDSIYTTINITLKVPILILTEGYNKLPDIPFTNYNLNLSKLQTISFLLCSLNRIGNDVVEIAITKHKSLTDSIFSKCTLTLRSVGSIVNLESIFQELQIFSSYPSKVDNVANGSENDTISIFLNINALNILFKSIIEANLYNQNKSLIIISVPDDPANDNSIYIIISIIQVCLCQIMNTVAGNLSNDICSAKRQRVDKMINALLFGLIIKSIYCYMLNSSFNSFQTFNLSKLFSSTDNFKQDYLGNGTVLNESKTFELMKLPYNMDEFAPNISKETVEFHYLKHHQGYVNKLNELGKIYPYIFNYTLEELIRMETRNNNIYNLACQIWNHDFYWLSLDPKSSGTPTPRLERLINESFESFSNFKQEFTDTAMKHFGSGWVWLLYYKHKPHLRIVDTHDADNPIKLFNTYPLLVLDIWEHAYYIDYRNDKKSYINGWFDKINWNRAEYLLERQLR